jgi:hypothetical protein
VEHNNRIKNILAAVLLAIFTTYYVDIGFFFHGHTINGRVVFHSHFHTNHHSASGTHTEAELNLLSALSACFAITALPSFIIALLSLLGIFSSEKNILSVADTLYNCSYLRAPPVLN